MAFIANPEIYVRSKMSEDMQGRICLRHSLSLSGVLLPGPEDKACNPPEGYTACNRFTCVAETLPPFNQFTRKVLLSLRIAPSQLHLNRYALLSSLFIIFMDHLFRPPTVEEIIYLLKIKSRGDKPSFTFLEAVRNCQVVAGAWSKLS